MKQTELASAALIIGNTFPMAVNALNASPDYRILGKVLDDKYRLIPKKEGLLIIGTFLNEITWNILSQNWGIEV